MVLTELDKDYLLELSRKCLECYFENGNYFKVDDSKVPENLKSNGATFVTLQKNDSLRGCMGKITAVQPIYLDLIENTYSAAFKDPRFPALESHEMELVKIEISLLSELEQVEYNDSEELVKKLEDKKPGVLIKSGFCQATYLPQVWESLSDPEVFLSQLCIKAGLKPDTWRENDLDVQIYDVIKFTEK